MITTASTLSQCATRTISGCATELPRRNRHVQRPVLPVQAVQPPLRRVEGDDVGSFELEHHRRARAVAGMALDGRDLQRAVLAEELAQLVVGRLRVEVADPEFHVADSST